MKRRTLIANAVAVKRDPFGRQHDVAFVIAAFAERHRHVIQVMQSVAPDIRNWKEYSAWKKFARNRIPKVRFHGIWPGYRETPIGPLARR